MTDSTRHFYSAILTACLVWGASSVLRAQDTVEPVAPEEIDADANATTSTLPETAPEPIAPSPALSAPPVERSWFVAVNGAPTGPFLESEIQARIGRGEIARDTLTVPVGGSAWMTAGSVFQGFPLLAPPQLAAAPGQYVTGTPSNPRPPSGIGGVVAGSILLTVGVINLATLPVCFSDWYTGDSDVCAGASVALGVIGIGAGLPLLITGAIRRKKSKEWRQRQRAFEGLQMVANPHFQGVSFQTSF